jgi:hypothetical protein
VRALEHEGNNNENVNVRKLLKEYEIETLREYQHRSRKQINEARKKSKRI